MTARFIACGGAGTVTGANFLLDTGNNPSTSFDKAQGKSLGARKILIDCGTIEREYASDTVNSAPFAYDPSGIDELIVTHAHADHIGRIPKLVRDGFHGVIHSTAPTKDLAEIMFEDALNIMHEDAKRRGGVVLYEKSDVERALSLWKTHEYHEVFGLGDLTIELLDAGHILGSAMVRVTRLRQGSGGQERSILFTGDLGNSPEPLLNDAESPEGVSYLVMESVYGDRVHADRERRQKILRDMVLDARNRSSVLLIPSFSIERTQLLLFELNNMVEQGTLDMIRVYLDAPLAIRTTAVYRKYQHLLNPAVREHFAKGDDPFNFKNLQLTWHSEESDAIHTAPNPKVIIAGAGMAAGGRIRAHLKRYASDPNAVILFVGYQVPGSLGRRIEDGAKKVQIDGEYVKIRAHIVSITGYSGHKDRDALLDFVESSGESLPAGRHGLEKVFVTMGEPKASMFLAQRIGDFLGVEALVPEVGQSFELSF